MQGQLKLIDFGIAKSIQGDTTSISRESQVRRGLQVRRQGEEGKGGEGGQGREGGGGQEERIRGEGISIQTP